VPSLKEQLGIIDEAYLVGISSRGLVNRAQKEIAGSGVTAALSDTELDASFADGTTVKISGTLNNFTCSCPSRTMCKHVVMAVMKAVENARASEAAPSDEPSGEPCGGFGYLLEYSQEKLIKEYGKSAFNEAVHRISAGENCGIEEGSLLTVKLMEGAFTVRFLPGAAAESICTCKAKQCRHRLEAILRYIRHKTGRFDFEAITEEGEVNAGIIPHVKNFIEEIFRIGLYRLPESYAEKCGQFAVLCHGAGFALFERLFETCGQELLLYGGKNAGFNKTRLIRNLCRIYQMCRLAGNGAAGKFKRQYMELPKIRVLGIGAYQWRAKSGFCGVTAVFFCPDIKKIVTFAPTLPVQSEEDALKGVEQMWRKPAWNLSASLGGLAKAELSLQGAKISDNGRLSSSEKTAGLLLKGQTDLAADELGAVVFDDYAKIKELFSADPDSGRTAFAVLKVSGIADGRFDRVSQTYVTQIIDRSGNTLRMKIEYSKINERTILNFEYLAKAGITPDAVTVSITIPDDGFEAAVFPIAVWMDGTIKNSGGEELFSGKDKPEFARFFREDP